MYLLSMFSKCEETTPLDTNYILFDFGIRLLDKASVIV